MAERVLLEGDALDIVMEGRVFGGGRGEGEGVGSRVWGDERLLGMVVCEDGSLS